MENTCAIGRRTVSPGAPWEGLPTRLRRRRPSASSSAPPPERAPALEARRSLCPAAALPLATRAEPTPTRPPPDAGPTDVELLVRAGAGEQRAFEQLVRRHHRRAYAVAFGIVHNAADAHDATQEVFVRVWRKRDTFTGEGVAFSTWLHSIAHNCAVDVLRRRRPHDELDDAPAEAMAWGGADPLERVERSRLAAIMGACVTRLPEIHRAVLVLREVEGLSYEEIALALDVPRGTVMSRLFHARRSLADLVRAELGDETPETATS